MQAPFQYGFSMPREIFAMPVSYTVGGFTKVCSCHMCSVRRSRGIHILSMNLGDDHEVVWFVSAN